MEVVYNSIQMQIKERSLLLMYYTLAGLILIFICCASGFEHFE